MEAGLANQGASIGFWGDAAARKAGRSVLTWKLIKNGFAPPEFQPGCTGKREIQRTIAQNKYY